MSVLISVPIGMAISQYSNLNHACVGLPQESPEWPELALVIWLYSRESINLSGSVFSHTGCRLICSAGGSNSKSLYFGTCYSKQESIPVGCVPPAHWPYLGGVFAGGCTCPGEGVPVRGVPAWGVCPGGSGRGVPAWGVPAGGVCLGGVPCDLSHHAFDVTCILPPHQLRLNTSAAAYILLAHCMLGYHHPPPPNRMTDRQV